MIINKFVRVIRKYSKFLFTIYMGVLILVIVLKFPTGMVRNTIKGWMGGKDVIRMSPQLIPFKTIIEYVKNVQSLNDWFFKNLAANIIMFLPYGIFLPFLIQKDLKINRKVILSGCLISVFIELFQYITALGQCDIDDVILNTVGVVIGLCIYKMIMYICIKNSNES